MGSYYRILYYFYLFLLYLIRRYIDKQLILVWYVSFFLFFFWSFWSLSISLSRIISSSQKTETKNVSLSVAEKGTDALLYHCNALFVVYYNASYILYCYWYCYFYTVIIESVRYIDFFPWRTWFDSTTTNRWTWRKRMRRDKNILLLIYSVQIEK